jgi:hypothetical protein
MTIKVNKQEWTALTADQQSQIASIISDNFEGQTIEPAEDGVMAADVSGVCQTACDLAQAAAIQLCGRLPFGKGLCITLAKTAGDVCRSNCG